MAGMMSGMMPGMTPGMMPGMPGGPGTVGRPPFPVGYQGPGAGPGVAGWSEVQPKEESKPSEPAEVEVGRPEP
jgi:hypothetical protein